MSEKIKMQNFESDFSYIETFGKDDPDNGFVPITIPEKVDFEIELWVNEGNGAKFKASRIGGRYKYCEKTDDSSVRIYIPLSRWSLGEGDLCRKLRVRLPGQGWNRESAEICVPRKTGYYLWDGPSDNSEVETDIQEIFSGAFKGEDGLSPTVTVEDDGENLRLLITDIQGTVLTENLRASHDVLDLTSLVYPVVGKQIVEKIGQGIAVDIYMKISNVLPLRQVVRIDLEAGGYRLYTGSVDAEKYGGCVVLNQLCYLLNSADGTVSTEIKQLAEVVAPKKLAEYIRKNEEIEYATEAGHADTADDSLRSREAEYAKTAGGVDEWSGHQFADYLDQPVRKGDKVRFEQVTTPAVTTPDFVPGGFAGAGAGLVTYANGQTGVEVDHIVARRTVRVNEVIINQSAHVGGRTLYSAANMECVRVVNGGTYWRCFFDTKNGQRANLWKVGDQAYCQLYSPDGTQLLSYYWRLVTSVGEDWINLSVTVCDGVGIPAEGDNIIQVGSQTDPKRQAMLEIDQTNGGQVVQYAGINSFNFANRNEVAFGVNDQGKPFFYAYGDLFVGDRDLSDSDATYITFQTPEGETRRRMIVSADLRIGRGSTGLTNLSEWAGKQQQIDLAAETASGAQGSANQAQSTANEAARATQAVNDYVQALESDVNAEMVAMNKRLDGVIENYFELYDPTLDNYPANEWITDKLKEDHNGDTFTNKTTGDSWKWKIVNGVWRWDEIMDTFEKELLNKIAKAQETADGRIRNFVFTPYPPYSVGDTWTQGDGGDFMRCIVSRASGVFTASDWDKAAKYTDDAAVNNLQIGGVNFALDTAADRRWNTWGDGVVCRYLLSDDTPNGKPLIVRFTTTNVGANPEVFGIGWGDASSWSGQYFASEYPAEGKTFEYRVPKESKHTAVWVYFNTDTTVHHVNVQCGNKPTDWSPAPEDVQADIDAAQGSADEANKKLTDWASDSIISPVEKTGLRQQRSNIISEFERIKVDAARYNVDITAYKGAYELAISALDKYSNPLPEDIAVGDDYADIAAYYQAREAIEKAIDAAADVNFLKDAFVGSSTDIDGGVVLSSFMGVRGDDDYVAAGMAGRNFILNRPFTADDETCPMIFAGNVGVTANANEAKTRIYPSGLLYTNRLQADGGIIGGFTIGSNWLKASGDTYSNSISAAAISLQNNNRDYENSTDLSLYPSLGFANHTGVSVYVNRKTERMDNIRNVGIHLCVQGKHAWRPMDIAGNFALYIEKGAIAGVRFAIKEVRGNYNVSKMDHTLTFSEGYNADITLPSNAEEGQEYVIVMSTLNDVIVRTYNHNIISPGNFDVQFWRPQIGIHVLRRSVSYNEEGTAWHWWV